MTDSAQLERFRARLEQACNAQTSAGVPDELNVARLVPALPAQVEQVLQHLDFLASEAKDEQLHLTDLTADFFSPVEKALETLKQFDYPRSLIDDMSGRFLHLRLLTIRRKSSVCSPTVDNSK